MFFLEHHTGTSFYKSDSTKSAKSDLTTRYISLHTLHLCLSSMNRKRNDDERKRASNFSFHIFLNRNKKKVK